MGGRSGSQTGFGLWVGGFLGRIGAMGVLEMGDVSPTEDGLKSWGLGVFLMVRIGVGDFVVYRNFSEIFYEN